MSLAPVSPLHNRAGILASLHPRLWYWQHLQDDRNCWCSLGAPDQLCDTGEALWRLARAPEGGRPRSHVPGNIQPNGLICWCSWCRWATRGGD